MKVVLFSTAIICAILDASTRASSSNSIEICQKHLQEYFTPTPEGYSLEKFNKDMFNDDCNLEHIHIAYFKPLFYSCSKCENCLTSLPRPKILCKACYSQNLSLPSCENCKVLVSFTKHVEIFRLYLNKFINKKYAQGSISSFFGEFNLSYPVLFLSILSELSLNSKEISILASEVSESIENPDESLKLALNILKVCAKYHSRDENVDSKVLFQQLIESKVEYPVGYAFYLTMRFDFNFYNRISSKNLFRLFRSAKIFELESNLLEYGIIIADIITKAEYLRFIMDKEDFFNLIGLSFETEYTDKLLTYFLSKKEYLEMLTEEKLISIFEKIFKIDSEGLIYKNLRIFKDRESYYNLNFKQYNPKYQNMRGPFDFDSSDDSSSSESSETSISELEVSETPSDLLSFELSETSVFHENSENNDSSRNIKAPKFTITYLIYREMITAIFEEFPGFTPNGLVKLACIIVSLKEKGKEYRDDFIDLLTIFCSKQRFTNFNLEHVLDVIDLYLKHKIHYSHSKVMTYRIFANIKSGDELDYIFDYIFSAPNRDIMLGIFTKFYETKPLSESKLNKLIYYSVNDLSYGFEKLFARHGCKRNLSTNFQLKYLKVMINQLNVGRCDVSALTLIKQKVFENLTKNDINLLFECCVKNKKYMCMGKIVKHLDLDQLKQIPNNKLSEIARDIFKFDIRITMFRIFRYIDTPFFYYSLPNFLNKLIISLENEDAFYINVVFESIIKNPLFQKCIDIYNNMEVQPKFFNIEGYLNAITHVILKHSASHPNFCKCFYENLNSKEKIAFKTELVKKILFDNDLNIKKRSDLLSEATYIENLIKKCISISPEFKKKKIDYFLNNFDFDQLFTIGEQFPELMKIVISQMDFDCLMETYNKCRIH